MAILKNKKKIDKIIRFNKREEEEKKKSEEDLTFRLITHGHDLIYFIFGCSIFVFSSLLFFIWALVEINVTCRSFFFLCFFVFFFFLATYSFHVNVYGLHIISGFTTTYQWIEHNLSWAFVGLWLFFEGSFVFLLSLSLLLLDLLLS